jgi:membrane-associated protein
MNNYYNLLMENFRIYNIWFLGILIILQCIGIPTGATIVVIASGAFAYAGEFNLVILLLEVWIFSIIGDITAYYLWKIAGEKTLKRFSKVKVYFEPKLSRMEIYLEKHGKGAVFFSRFLISAIGPLINAAAGIADYELYTFTLFVVFGELLWTCIYIGIGYWFADSWDTIIPALTQFSKISIYFFLLIVIIYFLIKLFKLKEVRE